MGQIIMTENQNLKQKVVNLHKKVQELEEEIDMLASDDIYRELRRIQNDS